MDTSKTIVITGGTGVLGSGFAEVLASQGHKVAILGRNRQAAERISDEIKAAYPEAKVLPVIADVLDKESLEAAKALVNDKFGPCDVLINGAGGNNPKGTTDKEYFDGLQNQTRGSDFFDLDFDAVKSVFDLNFLGTLLPSQIFAKDMVEREGCSIINITSMAAYTPLTKIPAYSGAKAAISNFTQWLAVHFSKTDIRVNAIAPGFFHTAQNHDLLFNKDGTPSARSGKILAATPMGRFGKPEELHGTLLWLVDEKASGFVTGVVIPVDGGFNAYSGV